jgi:hypothetical protein
VNTGPLGRFEAAAGAFAAQPADGSEALTAMTHDVRERGALDRGVGRQAIRVTATLIGVALLVIGAVLDWIPGVTGDQLTIRALVDTDFDVQSDLSKTAGGLTILIAMLALIALVDRSGWLTRLAGAAALVVFVMFVIQAYYFYGSDLGDALGRLREGVWLVLVGSIVLLVGGFLGARGVPPPDHGSERHPGERGEHL